MPGGWLHLGRRFFATLGADDLTPGEIDRLSELLEPDELRLFLLQPVIDRRHGLEAATRAGAFGGSGVEIRAAALHDVGKRHAHLGVAGRVAASIAIKLRLPLPAGMRMYRDHGPIGGAELAGIGCPRLIVDYARGHHGRRPATIPVAVWDRLCAADAEDTRSVTGDR